MRILSGLLCTLRPTTSASRAAATFYQSRMEFVPTNKILVNRVKTEDEEVVSFCFKYKVKGTKIPKSISLSRPSSEAWSNTLGRLRAKLVPGKKKRKHQEDLEEENPAGEGPEVSILGSVASVDPELLLSQVLAGASGLQIGDFAYSFVEDPPEVSKLKLKLVPMRGFPLMAAVVTRPEKAQTSVTWFRDELTLKAAKPWFKLDDATVVVKDDVRDFEIKDWTKVATGPIYVPTEYDVKRRIGVVVDCGVDTIAKASDVVEIQGGPSTELAWEARQAEHCAQRLGGAQLRLVSYNVLADLYMNLMGAQEDLWFPYCPKQFLKAAYRIPLLLRELPGYNADILCLQEVDVSTWTSFLQPFMRSQGFDGAFCLKGGKVSEGEAILVRSERLRLVSSHDVVLSDLMDAAGSEDADIASHVHQSQWHSVGFTSRPTVLQTTLVSASNDAGPLLLIGNTHLHSRPEADKIRVVQVALCLRHLERLQTQLAAEHPGRPVRLLLCGDLNNTTGSPAMRLGTKSLEGGMRRNGLFLRLIEEGSLCRTDPVWEQAPSELQPELEIEGMDLSHDLDLVNLSQKQAFTIYCQLKGNAHVNTIDHVFAQKDGIRLLKLAPVPSRELMEKHIAIPSKIAPSDHIPVICDIELS